MIFSDRRDAGKKLAAALSEYRGRGDTVVIGVPRGGVVVAYEVSKALGLPLDIVIVKKLGYPGNPELAIGAAGPDGYYLNEELVPFVPKEYIDEEIRLKQQEASDRVLLLRGSINALEIKGKTIIVIDDGVATGASMMMAVKVIRALNPAVIIVAVPVAPPETVQALKSVADKVVAVAQPQNFYAIGQFYQDFSQVSDEEARDLLLKGREKG